MRHPFQNKQTFLWILDSYEKAIDSDEKKIKNVGFVKEYYGFSEIQLSLVYTIVKIYNFLGCKIVNFKGCSD